MKSCIWKTKHLNTCFFVCKKAECHFFGYPFTLLKYNKLAFISYSSQGQSPLSLTIQFNGYKAKGQCETFATFAKENFMSKYTWYLTTRFLELTENTTPSRGVESSSHSVTHRLVTMPTKAMPTGRSFRNKPYSSTSSSRPWCRLLQANAPWPLQRSLGVTNTFNGISWLFFRNESALKAAAFPFIEKFIQFGTAPSTQCHRYPTYLSFFFLPGQQSHHWAWQNRALVN